MSRGENAFCDILSCFRVVACDWKFALSWYISNANFNDM